GNARGGPTIRQEQTPAPRATNKTTNYSRRRSSRLDLSQRPSRHHRDRTHRPRQPPSAPITTPTRRVDIRSHRHALELHRRRDPRKRRLRRHRLNLSRNLDLHLLRTTEAARLRVKIQHPDLPQANTVLITRLIVP